MLEPKVISICRQCRTRLAACTSMQSYKTLLAGQLVVLILISQNLIMDSSKNRRNVRRVNACSPISWSCRSDIEIFFDWAMLFFQRFDSREITVSKMGQTSYAEFIKLKCLELLLWEVIASPKIYRCDDLKPD